MLQVLTCVCKLTKNYCKENKEIVIKKKIISKWDVKK